MDLPTNDELNVQEVNLTYPVLQAAAFYFGKYCESKNNEFMLCKSEEFDPRRCINEGKIVTACTLDFFKQIKKHCREEFNQYSNCIDKSSGNSSFFPCRKTESVFSKCVLDNLGIERESFGYFCKVRVHDTSRPKPKLNILDYPDAAVPIPEEPFLPAKYNMIHEWAN